MCLMGWLALGDRTVNTHNTMKHEFVILILALLFVSAWVTDVRCRLCVGGLN